MIAMDFANDVNKFIAQTWDRVFLEVHGAAVYIDHPAAECLHWYTGGKGYLALKKAGALLIHELAMYNFRYPEVKGTKKAVIVSTSDNAAFYQRTMKMILAKSSFEVCEILCASYSQSNANSNTASVTDRYGCPLVSTYDQGLNYDKLKSHVKDWMTSRTPLQEPSVRVSFVPLFLTPISDNVFVTPTFYNLTPSLDGGLLDALLPEADQLANSFHTLFESLHIREDVYAMGKLSKYIADKLISLAAENEHKPNSVEIAASASVSLILVDRTLDLCTPTCTDTECFLAKVLRTLPRLPRHNNDVSVNMSRAFSQIQDEVGIARQVPGCLAAADKEMMNLLISKQPRNLLLELNRILNDLLPAKQSPSAKNTTRLSAHSLQKLVDKLHMTEHLDSLPDFHKKLQAIMAIIEASMSEKSSQFELLSSLEKLSLQNLSVSGGSSSILAQLGNIIRTRTSRGLDIENLLALLIHVYALAGTEVRFASEQEVLLEDAIADAVHQDIMELKNNRASGAAATTTSSYQQNILLLGMNGDSAESGESGESEKVRAASRKIAAHITDRLRAIRLQRTKLQDHASLMVKVNTREAARRVGLVEQLTAALLESESVQEMRDLQKSALPSASTGLKSLFRGRSLTKTDPRQNPCILIYVVGGISPEDIKAVRDRIVAKHRVGPQIILAGSQLLQPIDIVDKILFPSVSSVI